MTANCASAGCISPTSETSAKQGDDGNAAIHGVLLILHFRRPVATKTGSGPTRSRIACIRSTELARPEITASSASNPLRSSWHTHRVVTLLDEKHARARLELLLDELELALARARNPPMYSSRLASEFGKRILVGVCSMIVRLIELASASLGLWVAAQRTAVQLPPDLEAVLGELLEGRVRQEPRELIRPADEAPPIEQRPHDVKEIERDRSASDLVLQELRDVDSEERVPAETLAIRVSAGLSNAQA